MPILRRTSSPFVEPLSEDEVNESYWPSPAEVVVPKLVRHIRACRYAEPCAGNGKLIGHLQDIASCVWASDLCPRHRKIVERSAFSLQPCDVGTDLIITNPPFNAKFIYPFIDHVVHNGFVAWLFLPSDFAFRDRSGYVMPYCERMVAVGQVRFIEDSPSKGETNFAWFKFTPHKHKNPVFEYRTPTINSKVVPDRLKRT